jgi:hypothetical protein
MKPSGKNARLKNSATKNPTTAARGLIYRRPSGPNRTVRTITVPGLLYVGGITTRGRTT